MQASTWSKAIEEAKVGEPEAKQLEHNDQNGIAFSNAFNQQFLQQANQYHHITDKVNIQQIVREINEKGLTAKERSADFFLDSLFRRKENQDEQKEVEGEVIDSDPNDMEFRKGADEGESEEMLMDWQQDTTDVEFDDHWGVERRGEQAPTTDNENDDSDEDGGEMMPVFF